MSGKGACRGGHFKTTKEVGEAGLGYNCCTDKCVAGMGGIALTTVNRGLGR